jgi:pimeloyl-ACP methyl ester carboxylesterase
MPTKIRKEIVMSQQPEAAVESGYFTALEVGLREAILRIEELHAAIRNTPYTVLGRIPIVSGPSRLVQSVQDAVTAAVYAAIREGTSGLLTLGRFLENHQIKAGGTLLPPLPGLVQGALNGVVGDFLAATGNPLAVEMGFYQADRRIPHTTEAWNDTLNEPAGKLCIFLHGSAASEETWFFYSDKAWGAPDRHYGALLHAEFGYTPLYVRYNSGLSVAENGRFLAELLGSLPTHYPVPIERIVLIGHSMGGLVARSACMAAALDGKAWLDTLGHVVCLGSPHLGAPLAKFSKLAAGVLRAFELTEPIGKVVDVRSAGLKGLCDRFADDEACAHALDAIPFRHVGASLTEDPKHFLGNWLGDGLVPPASACMPGSRGDVKSVTLGGLGHLDLLNHPRVYSEIRKWLLE